MCCPPVGKWLCIRFWSSGFPIPVGSLGVSPAQIRRGLRLGGPAYKRSTIIGKETEPHHPEILK